MLSTLLHAPSGFNPARDLVKPADYQAEDAKATVLQNEVSAVPQIGDVWVTGKGRFKVVNIGQDPAGVVYLIQLRKFSNN